MPSLERQSFRRTAGSRRKKKFPSLSQYIDGSSQQALDDEEYTYNACQQQQHHEVDAETLPILPFDDDHNNYGRSLSSQDLREGDNIYQHGNGAKKNFHNQVYDKNRAPKLAAFLLFFFFAIAGTDHYILQSPEDKEEEKKTTQQKLLSSLMDPSSLSKNTGNSNETESSSIMLHNVNTIDPTMPNLDNQGNEIRLPSAILSNLADIDVPPITTYTANNNENNKEVPFFWHVPRSGGSTLKDIAAFCLHLTQASEVGPIMDPTASSTIEQRLQVIIDANTGAKFLNVDTTTPEGLDRAKSLNVASFVGLDLISTPYFLPATEDLFNIVNRGRMVTLLRHPIDRAVSMYYYLQSIPNFQGGGETPTEGLGSLEEYAKSPMVENNWMTRFLTNKLGGELTMEDEAMAKEILRRKCLVGLLKKKSESMRRFKIYFGWDHLHSRNNGGTPGGGDALPLSSKHQEDCEDRLLNWNWSGKNKHPSVSIDDEVWKMLKQHNTFDMRLYEYAEKLFDMQGSMFPSDSNH